MLSPGGLTTGVGTLRGLGGGTLGQVLRLLTCPLGLWRERSGPGFKLVTNFYRNSAEMNRKQKLKKVLK
jgi:hypothetical protein